MAQTLVVSHHLIWTAYGTWLPNDPRGSSPHEIRNEVLAELGELHYGCKKIQPTGKEMRVLSRSDSVVEGPGADFNEEARNIIAGAFGDVIDHEKLTSWACVIMPDHIHMLLRKH